MVDPTIGEDHAYILQVYLRDIVFTIKGVFVGHYRLSLLVDTKSGVR
jgi:hypothetical protein